ANTTPAEDPEFQRLQLDLLARQNRDDLARTGADARLEARIATYETAFRMQMQAPEAFDLQRESKMTQVAYGIGDQMTEEFGRQWLVARRLVERGVRFVQVNFSYPRNYWDAHSDLRGNHSTNARKVDGPIAGLLRDLKARGLLQETLVVFGTEFGRTPAAQG